ncbi:diguanylate cyclase [Methylobacterium sp. A54F]
MSRPLRQTQLGEVEDAILKGCRSLRFSPEIEHQFEVDEAARRCRHIVISNYIGLLVYHLFLVSDYRVVRDAFGVDLLMHFGVMTPVAVAIHLVLARRPPAWLREGLVSLSMIVIAGTIYVVVAASRSPDKDLISLATQLVLAFATIVLRIRFRHAIPCFLVIAALFSLGLASVEGLSADRAMMFNCLFLGSVVFSLVGCYNLEHAHRTSYLLTLRERMRSRDHEAASLRDALTGIGNRRALEAALAELAGRRAAEGEPVAVLLLDVDHFKVFNDVNGHPAGDACLRRVAALVTGSIRRGEGTVYRYGGEEFLVLLEAVSIETAVEVAERIRSTVAAAAMPRDRTATSVVTVSIGTAAGRIGSEADAAGLVAAADEALYAAKRSGRDRVWPPPVQAAAVLLDRVA